MDLENKIKLDDLVVNERSLREEKAEKYFVDRVIKPHPNHIMYEISSMDRVIRVAKYQNQDIAAFGNYEISGKVKTIVRQPDCWYFPSLNIANVFKKLGKLGFPKGYFIYEREQQDRGKGFKVNMVKTDKVK